tara:strand:- start:365 stop:826 length:462 start_codon:yes stop_codon:yes gene_type:complete
LSSLESTYKITLKSQRIITLEEIYQDLTYSSLIEGIPTRRLNKDIIKATYKSVNDKIYSSAPIHIIRPSEEPVDLPEDRLDYYRSKGEDWEPLSIPKICCMANFISNPITENYMFSNLTIIWFQKNWVMPIEDYILKQIKSLDWNRYANQGDY